MSLAFNNVDIISDDRTNLVVSVEEFEKLCVADNKIKLVKTFI